MEQPNLAYIESMSNGDKAFEEKIIKIIKHEFPEEHDSYLASLNKQDYRSAAALVHKLKHKISIFGMELGYGVANAYEQGLLAGRTDLSEEFEEVMTTIRNYIKQL